MQEGCLIYFASRALLTSESYAQIKKELLPIVFVSERFDQYLYARTVNVESDHKPLEAIAKEHG